MQSVVLLLTVFVGGVLSFFSPCIFPLLPVYLGVLLDTDESRFLRIFGRKIYWYSLVKTLAFIAGLSLIFIILGYGAGFLGSILYALWFRYLMGFIVILLGLHQMEVIRFSRLEQQKSFQFRKNAQRNQVLSSFILGLTFSFGWTPCVGPVLSSVLALAASGGNGAIQGGFLMFIYTLGLALPFLMLAFCSSILMNYFQKIKPHMLVLKKIGGVLIILMGLVLMFGNLNALAGIFG